MRPPKWTRDEVILAVDVFFNTDEKPTSDDIQELSMLLNSLPIFTIEEKTDVFRNENGVGQHLMRFRWGLKEGCKIHITNLFLDVYNEYQYKREELHKIAEAIKRCLPLVEKYTFGSIEETMGFQYGAILGHLHRNLEKKHGKAQLKNADRCELCGINPRSIYNLVNEDILETHWLVDPSKYAEGMVPQKKELLVVCPNCHNALHQAYPWIEQHQLATIFLDN